MTSSGGSSITSGCSSSDSISMALDSSWPISTVFAMSGTDSLIFIDSSTAGSAISAVVWSIFSTLVSVVGSSIGFSRLAAGSSFFTCCVSDGDSFSTGLSCFGFLGFFCDGLVSGVFWDAFDALLCSSSLSERTRFALFLVISSLAPAFFDSKCFFIASLSGPGFLFLTGTATSDFFSCFTGTSSAFT